MRKKNSFNAHTHRPWIGSSRKLNMTVFSFASINNTVHRPLRPDPGCSWPGAQLGPWYNGQYPHSGHIRAYPGVCCKANVSAKCSRRKRWVTLHARASSRATRFSNYASVCMFLALELNNVMKIRLPFPLSSVIKRWNTSRILGDYSAFFLLYTDFFQSAPISLKISSSGFVNNAWSAKAYLNPLTVKGI